MSRRLAAALVLILLAVGCEKPARHEPNGEHPHARAAPAGAGEPAAPDHLLRLHPEMLHDLRLTTAPAAVRTGGEGVRVLGELHVNEDAYAEIGTPVTARVLKPRVALGETVEAGQALVELHSVELGKARAEYVRASAHAQLARQALDRKRSLAADRIVPRRELQEAEADAQAAAADQAAAEAALKALGVTDDPAAAGPDSARFALRSPIAGTVIDRDAVQGRMAEPGRPLVRVADLGRLWLVAHAFERDAVRIPAGAAARVTFAALPGRPFTGTVVLVGQQVDRGSRTVPVRIDVANDDGLLRPGMSATAWLPLGEPGAPVVAVPAAALQRLADAWCVFIPHSAGAFEIRPVGRGRDLGGEVEIVDGLAAGEPVVVDGAFLLKAEAERTAGAGEHHEH